MATSMFFSGVLVLQKAITGMFTYDASVTGYRARDISQASGVPHSLTQTISTQVLYPSNCNPPYLVVSPRVAHNQETRLLEGLLDLVGEGAGGELTSHCSGTNVASKLQDATLQGTHRKQAHSPSLSAPSHPMHTPAHTDSCILPTKQPHIKEGYSTDVWHGCGLVYLPHCPA